MSELVITPNFTKKTARFHGAVAAGEHAAVRISGAASLLPDTPSDSTLRLRVVLLKKTLAVFPFVTAAMVEADDSLTQDVWEADGDDLICTLNLNTTQALKAFRKTPEMEVLAVLDDPVQHQLYFSDLVLMRGWPQEPADAPTNLDDYRDFVADTKAALAAHTSAISENAIAIAAEQTARQNADAELTSGIGSVSEAVSTKADAAALAAKQDAGDYATRQELGAGLAEKQDAGDYLTEHQSLEGLATTDQMNAALAGKADNSDLDALATKEELEAEESARQNADAGHDATDAQHDAGIESNAEGVQHAEEHITEHALDTTRHITAEERSSWNSSISSLQNAIAALVDSDSGLSIRAIASLVVSQVVANADTSFDTLKEIADWILNDTTGAAKMANDIAALQTLSGQHIQDGKLLANAIRFSWGISGYIEFNGETIHFYHPSAHGTPGVDVTLTIPVANDTLLKKSDVVSPGSVDVSGFAADAKDTGTRLSTLESRGYLIADESGVYAVIPD